MTTLEAIASRRSIRKFRPEPVPRELLERVLAAAVQAPSGKNRQPWHFVVVRGERKRELVGVMASAVARLKEKGVDIGSAEWSADSMAQAAAVIFVFNSEAPNYRWGEESNVVDIQSIGGAIQTLLLAARDMGLGTLWICDVFYAYDELREWLGRTDQMVAAVAVGYADEAPEPRARKPWQQVTTWIGD